MQTVQQDEPVWTRRSVRTLTTMERRDACEGVDQQSAAVASLAQASRNGAALIAVPRPPKDVVAVADPCCIHGQTRSPGINPAASGCPFAGPEGIAGPHVTPSIGSRTLLAAVPASLPCARVTDRPSADVGDIFARSIHTGSLRTRDTAIVAGLAIAVADRRTVTITLAS
jgi:hypothetical protein